MRLSELRPFWKDISFVVGCVKFHWVHKRAEKTQCVLVELGSLHDQGKKQIPD